jgi:hypothetical protein
LVCNSSFCTVTCASATATASMHACICTLQCLLVGPLSSTTLTHQAQANRCHKHVCGLTAQKRSADGGKRARKSLHDACRNPQCRRHHDLFSLPPYADSKGNPVGNKNRKPTKRNMLSEHRIIYVGRRDAEAGSQSLILARYTTTQPLWLGVANACPAYAHPQQTAAPSCKSHQHAQVM